MIRAAPSGVDVRLSRLCRGGLDGLKIGKRGAAILAALLDARGATVTKDTLLTVAWPERTVDEANLSVQVAALRKALSQVPNGNDLIVTVPRVGYRLRSEVYAGSAPSEPPRVAILPIVDLTGSCEPLAKAVGEHLAGALQRSAIVSVAPPRLLPTDARFVVTGSIQQFGSRLRAIMHLVDTSNKLSCWSAHVDGGIGEILKFEDRLVGLVAGSVEPAILRAEINILRRRPPARPDGYHLFLLALPHLRGTSSETRREAIRLLDLAVETNPTLAVALAYAAWAHEREDTFGPGLEPDERDRTIALAERALAVAGDDPLVQAIAALVLLNLAGERERSLAMLARAEAAAPYCATVLSLFAFANVMVGDVSRGKATFLRCLDIAPGALENYELLVGVALAHLFSGEPEDAVKWSLDSMAQNADWLGAYWVLATAYAELGRVSEANATVQRMLRRAPDMRMRDIERIGKRYDSRFRILVEALRASGLPD